MDFSLTPEQRQVQARASRQAESPVVERSYRDIKGLQIYEGTSHIQRIVIARELVGRE